jgi:peptide/nickel transport system permease protein
MARFLVRRILSLFLTMLIVSIVVFAISELAPGDVVRHMLGQFATPEQEESLRAQLGLTRPIWVRYISWLAGSDWLWARPKVKMPLRQTIAPETGYVEWWAEEPDGTLIRWRLEGDDLIAVRRYADGRVEESTDNERWQIDASAETERLRNLRLEVLDDERLTLKDRNDLVYHIADLIEILNTPGLTQSELLDRIEEKEEALTALADVEIEEERTALQTSARGMLKNAVVEALAVAQTLSEASGGVDEEYLRTVPNQLGKAATLLEGSQPELAEKLRSASKSVLARKLDDVSAISAETVGPLSDLAAPLTALAQALEDDDYTQAAVLLNTMFDPSSPPDETLQALMAEQFADSAKALRDVAPEQADNLTQASESLESGDIAATHEALQQFGQALVATEPLVARNNAIRKSKVGRFFWGVDNLNHAVKWETGGERTFWRKAVGAGWWVEKPGGASEYIPLQRGLLRGDPGESVRSRQAVGPELLRRLRNSGILAALAFVVVMPLALLLGIIAGLNEGKPIDRILSVLGLMTTSSPNFATGVLLILLFSVGLGLLPGATVFTSSTTIFERPKMLVLPVMTLTLIELGYVLRITRASMAEVMEKPYIRTAFLKGLPYRRIVFRHALRNALIAPITVIMLHVNWLMGGIVVVEAIFGFPGLGTYLLASALYKDVFAIEAGAMLMVVLAVGTQLVADVIYTFLNPRIRYA